MPGLEELLFKPCFIVCKTFGQNWAGSQGPRPARELNPYLEWTDNIWMGVSVENADYTFRIDHLRKTGAKIKFLSAEPLLGPISKMNLKGINWVIVGGESGPGARPLDREWVVGVRDHCLKTKVPFFFKQWGGIQKKKAGRLLDGRTWDQMPVDVNIVKV
jgi:protein gp37